MIDEVVNAFYYDAQDKESTSTYHHDALQSVVGLSGHAGTVEETLRYGPFGDLLEQAGSSPSTLRFTGREFDAETGLYYYRARYYDPEVGRFLAEDPLGFGAGVNLYTYVGNNPMNANDPMGLDTYHGGVAMSAGAGEPFSSWSFGQGGAVQGMIVGDTRWNFGIAGNAMSGPHFGLDADINFVFGKTYEETIRQAYHGYQRQAGGSIDVPLGPFGSLNVGYERLLNEDVEAIGWEVSVGWSPPGDALVPIEVHDYTGRGFVEPLFNLGPGDFTDAAGNTWELTGPDGWVPVERDASNLYPSRSIIQGPCAK